jgi:hypothetical protein
MDLPDADSAGLNEEEHGRHDSERGVKSWSNCGWCQLVTPALRPSCWSAACTSQRVEASWST